jgi:ferritin
MEPAVCPRRLSSAAALVKVEACSRRAMRDLTRAINNQLASEFQASHAYLAMSIWLREKDLAGFSTYMLDKSYEERGHAARLIAYLVDSDQEVELPTLAAPERS